MPVARVGHHLVYFAHVPKCAGTSVESYMEARFGPLAMLDRYHLSVPAPRRWSRTSPQHIDTTVAERLFPAGFFDHVFTVVRHPVDRLASAFRFHRDVTSLVPEGQTFAGWLRALEEVTAEDPYAYDNHGRAMVDIVPDDARVFRLEDGLSALVTWLDEIEGAAAGPRELPRLNTTSGARMPEVGDEEVSLIAARFAADFERFGYDPHAPRPVRPVRDARPSVRTRLRRLFGAAE